MSKPKFNPGSGYAAQREEMSDGDIAIMGGRRVAGHQPSVVGRPIPVCWATKPAPVERDDADQGWIRRRAKLPVLTMSHAVVAVVSFVAGLVAMGVIAYLNLP